MNLVSGLFKIVCATCPAHATVHASVRYQDGLLVHYECHGAQHLAAMYPYFSRTITQRNGDRYRYSFNVVKPDVSCVGEPIECIYVLDTELDSLSPTMVAEMRQQLTKRIPIAEAEPTPSMYGDDEWKEILADGRKALTLLTRFAGGV